MAETEHASIPPWLLRTGSISWRLLAAGLVIWGVASLASHLTTIVMPVAVALLIAGVLEPVVRRLGRPSWPEWVAPLVAVLVVLTALIGVTAAIGVRVAEEWPQLSDQFSESLVDIEERLSIDLPALPGTEDSSDATTESLTDGISTTDATGVLRVGSEILFGLFLTFALAFLFLKDGSRMWRWMLERAHPDRRERIDAAGRAAWSTTGAYVRGLTLVALFDAAGVAAGLLVLGVPLVATLAVLQFLASYVPTIGAIVAGGVALVVALGSEGVVTAVILLVVVVAVQQIGNDVIEPWVMNRSVHLHPAVVLIAVGAGAILWGIPGALLFVPLAAAIHAGATAWREDALRG